MVGEAPKLELQSLEFEKRMVLLTYSLALMMLAETAVTSRYGDGNQDNDRKWKLATSHLIKSQSIVWYLVANSNSYKGQPIPPQLQNQTGFITGLQTLIGGSLHLLIIYKDLERELQESSDGYNSSSTTTTSRNLLSRVAIYAADKFGAASQLISSSSSSFSSSGGTGSDLSSSGSTEPTKSKMRSAMSRIAPSSHNGSSSSSSSSHNSSFSLGNSSDTLSGWLSEARKFCIADTYKLSAIDQAQKGQTGQAIGFLTAALELLGANSKLKKVVSSTAKPGTIQYQQDQLKQTILPILHSYTTENNNYTFQTIPKASELESNRPSGRQVVAAEQPWVPPSSLISDSVSETLTPSSSSRTYY
ncbi:hypothetical protein AWJ20_3819 [Sugiyamaella lignohabitans]|uniref:PH-response regulator protein palC n=1 Tax=Sugiyamaella lignohabitans TaxID=796027 RepID=A0A167BZK2_9ASCO|nr:uncharacterized protein AWJ20_3819 [Sugiyamaella lignohabitans]ANB11023.1 hypothetical protein AWJ20_3819 [Sugiyamaella lignohabitans]